MDAFLLRCSDHLVRIVWQKFKVPKGMLIRLLIFAWFAINILIYPKIVLYVGFFAFLFGLNTFMIDYRYRRVSRTLANQHILLARQSLPSIFVRKCFFYYTISSFLVWVVLSLYRGRLQPVDFVSSTIFCLILYVVDSLYPEDPPVRRKEPKPSLNFTVQEA